MIRHCHGCYSCITPCGREEGFMEMKNNYSKEYAYYSIIEDAIITLHVELVEESPYLILLGEI